MYAVAEECDVAEDAHVCMVGPSSEPTDGTTTSTRDLDPALPSEGVCATLSEAPPGSVDGRERGASPLPSSMGTSTDCPDELARKTAHRSPRLLAGDGCKSGEERAASPSGPSRDLLAGFREGAGAMRGDGQGLGPPLDPRPHGPPSRGVPPLSTAVTEQHADRAFRPAEKDEEAAIVFSNRLHFREARAFNLDPVSRPLLHPTFRCGTIVPLPHPPATSTGRGYMDHVPLTVQIRVNSATGAPISSLLDTGASLSAIDAALLARLGGTPQGAGMTVKGLGEAKTLGFATVIFFIEARDSRDRQIFLECTQDLHVLPSFAPGVCLGRDFIDGHDLTISPARGRARVDQYTFAVNEQLDAPYAKEAELCAAVDVDLLPDTQAWVPVHASCLAPGVDYTVHPRLSVTPDETVRLAGPAGLMRHSAQRHVLLGNFGTAPFRLQRGTKVADAIAVQMGDAVQASTHIFTLDTTGTAIDSPAPPTSPGPDEPVAEPIDAFEPDVDTGWNPRHDAATTLVDDHFRVGVGESGEPPSELVEALRRHKGAFALDGRPGLVRGAEMAIELKPGAALRPEAPRRASPEKRAAMDAAIDQLLDWDVVEPSESSVSFPVLMVRQYGKWRFCVDFRQLNANTVEDRYPLPTVDSVFQTLCGKRFFSSLDAIRGYHQLPVRPADRWKTAFVCHRGLYQYKTVPFGLRNAPAVFQRLMDRLLGSLRWRDAVVYIDDIVVASRTMAEHVTALETILSNAEREGLRFSPSKCTFGVGSLVLLGRKVSGAGVAVWADRAAAVRDLPRPTTLRELYHALGLFGYYRAFIPSYAQVV